MPELPEVEIVVRGLQRKVTGRKITGVDLRLPKIVAQMKRDFVQTLPGLEIKKVRRRGKYIILELSDNKTLLFHLKLTGQLTVTKNNAPVESHTHLILTLSGGCQLRLRDLRQFGRVYLVKSEQVSQLRQLSKLGPEANEVSKQDFLRMLSQRKACIKPLLLNQEFLAGLGNIYSDEALYQAGIHPLLPANKVSLEKAEKLYQAIREILNKAINYGGSSVANYLDTDGKPGQYQKQHLVYQRAGQPCPRCRNLISRIKIGGRSSYFCPGCQREDGRW